jgi:hypothetical protein
MSQRLTAATAPMATLEIGDRRLPATMVAGRLRADLPRIGPRPVMPRRLRARLVMTALLALIVPAVNVTRRRTAA